ncbi:transcriptional regulator [Carboxydothermus islandicus]|uniref:Transcriptional regulator n=1 Tax=Carboxydothermus islandicus TaxID=661089 RepID=A0A1L8D5J6_9THEO|nr:helix-turn-helix transcriptional regulator [Carboxydothermus islandicus]GAV26347.1 transcriptional regulator [Carboxydothermus islandicus]
MAVKNRIRLIRKKRKIKSRELAELVGISYWALNKYEIHEREPSIEILWKIAKELKVSLEYLAGLVEEENPYNDVIKKIYQLPDEAIEEVNLFLDFLLFKYKA